MLQHERVLSDLKDRLRAGRMANEVPQGCGVSTEAQHAPLTRGADVDDLWPLSHARPHLPPCAVVLVPAV